METVRFYCMLGKNLNIQFLNWIEVDWLFSIRICLKDIYDGVQSEKIVRQKQDVNHLWIVLLRS